MKKTFRIFWLILIVLWMAVFPVESANKFFWATGLIGATGALDTIDGNLLTSGDMAIVGYVETPGTTTPQTYFYKLIEYPLNPPDESSPDVITPNTNAGTKRWIFTPLYAPNYVGAPDPTTINYWTAAQYFDATVTLRKVDETPIIIFPSDPPTVASLPLIGTDGAMSYLETPDGCILGGASGGSTTCLGASSIWSMLQTTVFSGTAVVTDQFLCGVDTDGVYSAYSCGEPATYTEPGTNLPLCRTAAAAIGACSNITDIAYAAANADTTGTASKLPVNTATDASGEESTDSTTGQYRNYDGTRQNVFSPIQFISFVIPAPAEADDINIMKAPYGMTILGINCIVQGTTSATGQIQECSATGGDCADLDSDIACDADGAADDGSLTDSAIASGAWLRWKTTSLSGTPTFLTVTVQYRVVAD